MSQKNPPGYPLPSGELGNDEIVCQLVYLPNRDEYWQAFLGALSYMATWRAWERDDDKRGRDAASNWREAFELTMECWRMACLGELKQDVSDILDHLRNAVPCCGDIVIYGDSTVYITTIIPGVGDDPTHYGETEVTDWDEWSEYLCHNAHLWVDELAKQSNQLELALSVGGMSLGLAGFIVAAIVLFVVGGFLSGVVIMAIVSGVVAGYTANMFSTAADDIDAAREDIICAIINGASLADAVENALASGLAWDIFFSQLDYETAIAILYEGGNGDDIFLEAEKRTDCDCEQIGEFLFFSEFGATEFHGWLNPLFYLNETGMEGGWCARALVSNHGDLFHSMGTLCTEMSISRGAGDKVLVHRLSFWYQFVLAGGHTLHTYMNTDAGSVGEDYPDVQEWTFVEEIFNPPHEFTYNKDPVIEFGPVGLGSHLHIDRITIDFDFIPA